MPPTLLTYELYIDDGSGEPRFEPLVCLDHLEAMSAVRHMIREQRLASVEVRLLGQPVFSLQG